MREVDNSQLGLPAVTSPVVVLSYLEIFPTAAEGHVRLVPRRAVASLRPRPSGARQFPSATMRAILGQEIRPPAKYLKEGSYDAFIQAKTPLDTLITSENVMIGTC